MTAPAELEGCLWREPGGLDAARTIQGFLAGIGIEMSVEAGLGPTFLPGIDIRGGSLLVDPEVAAWPGDLLHEAGHIAVTEGALRAELRQPSADGGEEMAAIAWSVAAAKTCGIGLEVLFHDEGYKGDPLWLRGEFESGKPFGVPLLAWYGLTSQAEYPAMYRWLR